MLFFFKIAALYKSDLQIYEADQRTEFEKKTVFSRKNSDIFLKKVVIGTVANTIERHGKYTWRCKGWYTRS